MIVAEIAEMENIYLRDVEGLCLMDDKTRSPFGRRKRRRMRMSERHWKKIPKSHLNIVLKDILDADARGEARSDGSGDVLLGQRW